MATISTCDSSRGSKVNRLSFLLALAVGFAASAQGVIPARLPFADEAVAQPDFKAFRDGLIAAAERGEYSTVRRILDPNIHYESGVYGLTGFEKEWKVRTSPRQFLREFTSVLRLGGRFAEPAVFVAPYVATDFPDDDDESLYVVVVQRPSTLFAKPDRSAKAVATLSDEVMRYELAAGAAGWYEVTLVDGRTGFIQASRVRQPDDYHATFRKIGRQWRLVEFLGGEH